MSQKIRGVKGTRDVLPTDTYVKDDDPWVRIGHYHLIEQAAYRAAWKVKMSAN